MGVTNTWIAAAAGNWSDDANWSLGHSPIAGEDPTFDGTSVNNCNADDPTPTGVLTITAGYTGTITQSSDMHISGYSQAGGTFTGVTTKWVYCAGNFIFSSGMITNNLLRLNMTGNYKILTYWGNNNLHSLSIEGKVNLTNTCYVYRYFIVNGELSIASTKFVGFQIGYVGISVQVVVNGKVFGPGSLNIQLYNINADFNAELNVDCKISIYCPSANKNRVLTLLNNITTTDVLTIYSNHATYTCTLDLNGHKLAASSITVGPQGILQCGEGTITTGALDSSAGTITEETATWIFERGSTIKVAAAQKLYNVIAKGSSALKLLSNLGISELFAHPAEIDRNGFTLTLDQPDKEYAGLRRPIIVPVKKLDIGKVGLLDGWLRDLGGLLR